MRRGTTPTITLKVKDASVDLTELQEIYVTFSQSDARSQKRPVTQDLRQNLDACTSP